MNNVPPPDSVTATPPPSASPPTSASIVPSTSPFPAGAASPSASFPAPTVSSPTGLDSTLSPSSTFIGAIDQGTSSTRFILFDQAGRIIRQAQQEFPQLHVEGQPGWAEHDPLDILSSVQSCIEAVLNAHPPIRAEQVVGVGITNQRETSLVWDSETGQPLHHAIVWHDTRTAGLVAQMAAQYPEGKDHFRRRAGLPLSTYFSALKLRWMMEHVPAVQAAVERGTAKFGTVDSWLIWNLTGGATAGSQAVHVTDVTNASRTLLMNIETLEWDEECCREFRVPLSMLPQIRSNSEVYGQVRTGALKGVPIAGCVGDQQAAMLGQLCIQPGQAKNTYGTGCFMLLNTGTEVVQSTHGLLTTVCFQLGPKEKPNYALEGSVAVAGSAVRWLRDEMQLINAAKEVDPLALQVADANDMYFVPAFSGLLSPYWRDDARGVIVGLTHSSNRSHLARAVLYSTAYQTREVLDAMTADTQGQVQLQSLQVDGGMCASNVLMQFQADMLRIPVVRPASLEATASGAAFCAGLAVGFWSSPAELLKLSDSTRDVTTFTPSMEESERERLYKGWKKAVQRTFGWVEKEAANPIGEKAAASIAAAKVKPLPTANNTSLPSSQPAVPSSVSSLRKLSLSSSPLVRRFPRALSHLATLGVGVLMGASLAALWISGPNTKNATPASSAMHK